MPTPVNFAEVTVNITLAGDAEQMNCVFGIMAPLAANWTQQDADDLSSIVGDFFRACMAPQYTYDGITIGVGTGAGDVYFESVQNNGVGALGANALTQNVASLFRKSTGVGGRRNRGRMFVPGPAETTVDAAGTWDGTVRANLQSEADTFLASLAAINNNMVILHPARPAPDPKPVPPAIAEAAPTEVTSLILDTRVATQRRRLRQVPVRSRRFFGPTSVGVIQPVLLYTVPAGRTAVIRSVTLVNTASSGANTATIYINGTSSTNVVGIIVVNFNASVELPITDMVLNPGDTLHGRWGSTANNVRITAFGSLLDGEPQ